MQFDCMRFSFAMRKAPKGGDSSRKGFGMDALDDDMNALSPSGDGRAAPHASVRSTLLVIHSIRHLVFPRRIEKNNFEFLPSKPYDHHFVSIASFLNKIVGFAASWKEWSFSCSLSISDNCLEKAFGKEIKSVCMQCIYGMCCLGEAFSAVRPVAPDRNRVDDRREQKTKTKGIKTEIGRQKTPTEVVDNNIFLFF